MLKPSLVVAALSLLSPVLVSAQNLTPLQQKVQDVMGMDHRTEAELARDSDRDPVSALDFIGLERYDSYRILTSRTSLLHEDSRPGTERQRTFVYRRQCQHFQQLGRLDRDGYVCNDPSGGVRE